jgi:hypothetical protein
MADEPMSIETFAASLPTSFIDCRELGHTWRAWRAAWDDSARAYDRELRCSRCKTVRRQLLNEFGHVLTNTYRYPTDYQAKGVESGVRVSRDVFRLEALTRYLHRES